MKKILLTSLIAIMMTQLSANAFDWGKFFKWFFFGEKTEQTTTVETSDLTKVLDEMKTGTKTADAKSLNSVVKIVPLLTTQTDATKITSEIEKIKASSVSDAEKSKQIQNIIKDYTTVLQNNRVAVLLILKTSTDADKEVLKTEVLALTDDIKTYDELATKGTDTASKVISTLDDEQVKLLEEINKTSTEIQEKGQIIADFVTQVKLFAALTGIKIK